MWEFPSATQNLPCASAKSAVERPMSLAHMGPLGLENARPVNNAWKRHILFWA